MRTFIIRLLLVSVSMIAATLQAQNITFNHLTTDDGLSQFSVNSLYIDENGVLWIGTREGLNRYDGEDIQTAAEERPLQPFLQHRAAHGRQP